jgi:hypothetical protein
MFHGGHNFFLLGLPFLPFGGLFSIGMLICGTAKNFRFSPREWMLLATLLVSLSLLFVPYRAWEHFDMTVCSSDALGDAFLLDTARTGDLELVTRLVAEGHNVNRDSGSEDTPLSSAVKGRKLEVVAFLSYQGANVNAWNSLSDETPLMKAAYSGDTEILMLLLAQGADPCTINKHNEIAQLIAEKNHNQEFASYLATHFHGSLPPPLPTSCANESVATCVEVH